MTDVLRTMLPEPAPFVDEDWDAVENGNKSTFEFYENIWVKCKLEVNSYRYLSQTQGSTLRFKSHRETLKPTSLPAASSVLHNLASSC